MLTNISTEFAIACPPYSTKIPRQSSCAMDDSPVEITTVFNRLPIAMAHSASLPTLRAQTMNGDFYFRSYKTKRSLVDQWEMGRELPAEWNHRIYEECEVAKITCDEQYPDSYTDYADCDMYACQAIERRYKRMHKRGEPLPPASNSVDSAVSSAHGAMANAAAENEAH